LQHHHLARPEAFEAGVGSIRRNSLPLGRGTGRLARSIPQHFRTWRSLPQVQKSVGFRQRS
jgi:hypothetical protein